MPNSEQKIEAPMEDDVTRIARQLIHASSVAREVVGKSLDGTMADLRVLQEILDAHAIERDATYTLQALGVAFGRVFLQSHPGYDWWMVEDEGGRDPAVRYLETTFLCFPQTMLSKRVEDGDRVNVEELFEQLSQRLEDLVDKGWK
jgi:hypothetical protein